MPSKRSVDASTLISRGTDQQRALQAIPVNANIITLEKNQKTEVAALRFAIGDQVECNMQMAGWLHGVVVALYDKNTQVRSLKKAALRRRPPSPLTHAVLPPWQDELVAPYQVMLADEGSLIWAPADTDDVIRKLSVQAASRTRPRDRRAEHHSRVHCAVSWQIDACDPRRTLDASDFQFVLTEVTETVMRVMSEDGRTKLDDEDRGFITRRVAALVQPAPGASEGPMVVVADDCQRKDDGCGCCKRLREGDGHLQRPANDGSDVPYDVPRVVRKLDWW
tara:strand:- start:265 stop:1101 length:837 start_codon:yes stop_codon:yes gene_type:complete